MSVFTIDTPLAEFANVVLGEHGTKRQRSHTKTTIKRLKRHLRREPTLADLKLDIVQSFASALMRVYELNEGSVNGLYLSPLNVLWQAAEGVPGVSARPDVGAFTCLQLGVLDPPALDPTRKVRKPSRDTVARMQKAASAIASGLSNEQAAQAADASVHAMRDWQRQYPELWQTLYGRSMNAIADLVRQQAGTDAIFDNADTYTAKALNCEKWLRDKGERLFDHGEQQTLGRFFETYYRPVCLTDANRKTIESYETALRLWAIATGDPALTSITVETLAKFRQFLSSRRGKKRHHAVSPNTVRSQLKHIQFVLDKAGMPGRRNRDAAGILQTVPYIKPPRERATEPRVAKIEAIEAVYVAAVAASLPNLPRIKPPAWWRALLVVALNTALRRRSLFALEWGNVRWDDRLLIMSATQMKSGRSKAIPMTDAVCQHLQSIRSESGKVFEWPHTMTHFYKCFYQLQREAGIAESERFGLHAIRRTAATRLWSHNPQAAQLMLDHASMQTTIRRYVQSAEILRDAVAAIPQPAAFAASPNSAVASELEPC